MQKIVIQPDAKLDAVSDSLLLLFPLFFRKLLRTLSTKSGSHPINMEFHILVILANTGELPVSAIGNRLGISRPNMTSLIDRLIERGYVKRFHNASDRRITNINITDHGKKLLAKRKSILKTHLKKQFEVLSSEELNVLQTSLDNARQIIARIGID